ncbi:PAS domain-containing protein [Aromatoleum toluvorans]|uniref:histidine kinase n=1 Tax=Aromatoleum toluvorans TaxID=92002 RepID=A0ABX1Q385_9RHOO|nr:PAS domain-containing protein [Aromatoleum toluvorans]NMG46174.1 PAS domain-containing protein [Aromatoleum toluvorans]
MFSPAQQIFNSLSDGLIVFERGGHVRFANRAAAETTGVRAGQDSLPAPIRAEVERAVEGPLPAELDVDALQAVAGPAPHAPLLRALLLPSTGSDEYVIVLRRRDDQTVLDRALATLQVLLQGEPSSALGELGAALDRVIAGLAPAEPDATRLERDRRQALARAAELRERIERVGTVLELSLAGPLTAAQDRVDLARVAQRAMQHVARRTADARCRIALSEAPGELTPVYGSEKWLERGLVELFAHAIEACPHATDIAVSLRQRGGVVVLALRPTQAGGPFSRPRARRPAALGASTLLDPAEDRELGLEIVRRVFEAHGGTIAMKQDLAGLIDITVEIPTGAPHAQDDAVLKAQLERYAHDLVQLVRAGVTVKRDEQDHPRR